MPTVMLCEDLTPLKLKLPSLCSYKYDGVRAVWNPGDAYLTSRNEKPIFGMGHIIDEFNRQGCGPQDMELIIPDMEFNKLSGLIRNHSATPEAVAMLIDAPSGCPDLIDRLNQRAEDSAACTRIDHCVAWSMDDITWQYETALQKGFEGVVVKTMNHKYSGRRSYDWMRLVPDHSIDVMVTGLYEGEGKLTGLCGGFYFVFNDQVCKCGTMLGITHEERGYIWFAKKEYIGRTAIVEYKELQPSGKPRQPRFKGWRYDK